MRAAIEQRKKIPRVVVLGAPSYKVTCVIIFARAEPVPPLPPPPSKVATTRLTLRIAKDNDVCVAGAIGGAAPIVTFWGEGEDVTGLSRPPRLGVVCRGSTKWGALWGLARLYY